MSPIVFPDPKWLDFLKAGGPAFWAIALACGVFLLLEHGGYVETFPGLAQSVIVLVWLLTSFLALTNTWAFFTPHIILARIVDDRQRRKFVREYINHMTPIERRIIGYLLAHNQRTFTAAPDGGHAVTLISNRIIEYSGVPGQTQAYDNVPFAIAPLVWNELVKQRDKFPYTHTDDGEPEREPWRERSDDRV
jgi:Super-infection exclusion protein B